MTTFGVAVGVVVGLRPEEEVIGPDAGWVVAVVEDAETVRDRAVLELPRHAMCEHLLAIPPGERMTRPVLVGSVNPATVGSPLRASREPLTDWRPWPATLKDDEGIAVGTPAAVVQLAESPAVVHSLATLYRAAPHATLPRSGQSTFASASR